MIAGPSCFLRKVAAWVDQGMNVRTRDRDRVLDAPAPLDVIDAAAVAGAEAGARVQHFPGFLHGLLRRC